MSGIKHSANRPKVAKHLRNTSEKTFVNRSKEDRERDHALTDAWAEKQRLLEPERVAQAISERKHRERQMRRENNRKQREEQ